MDCVEFLRQSLKTVHHWNLAAEVQLLSTRSVSRRVQTFSALAPSRPSAMPVPTAAHRDVHAHHNLLIGVLKLHWSVLS